MRKKRQRSRRDQLVRAIALDRGITMTQVAQEMELTSAGLSAVLESKTPRGPTVERIRRWIEKYGPRKLRSITNVELL